MRTYSAKPARCREEVVSDSTPEGPVSGPDGGGGGRYSPRGKHKTMYTPHIDTGDTSSSINAEKVKLTGKKGGTACVLLALGHPGGIKNIRRTDLGRQVSAARHRACHRAHDAQGQSLGAARNSRSSKVYAGATHPHEAQSPEKLDLAARNAREQTLHLARTNSMTVQTKNPR